MTSNRKSLNWLAASAALLTGCTTIDLDTGFDLDPVTFGAIVDQRSDAFPRVDPLFINDEIKQMVDSHLAPRDSEQTRVEKLQDILYDEEFLDIQYDDSRTHTALEVFAARRGNCLSVMNLYVAMARYAGVDASFQTVEVKPAWDRRGNLLVISQHINATGRFTANRYYVVDFTPEISLQQLTADVIEDTEARALYFNNLAVEALIDEDFAQALVYLKNALFLDPGQAIAWNNIGTTYSRLGNQHFAEFSYQMAFNQDRTSAIAINNLAKLYRSMGRLRLARDYERAIEHFNNRNPYWHFMKGQVALGRQDVMAARDAFRKALRLKEEEPDFHLALAAVYLTLGEVDRARRLNESAQRLVAQSGGLYQPGPDRLRIINRDSILRDSMPGLSIIFQ